VTCTAAGLAAGLAAQTAADPISAGLELEPLRNFPETLLAVPGSIEKVSKFDGSVPPEPAYGCPS
jgi:hypothetical protein